MPATTTSAAARPKCWGTAARPSSSATARRLPTRCGRRACFPAPEPVHHPPPEQRRENRGIDRDLREVVLARTHPEEVKDRQAGDPIHELVERPPPPGAQRLHGAVERRERKRREQHE